MPSITRAQCRDTQELKLWDECYAAECRAAKLLALVRGAASAAEDLLDIEQEHTLATVTPDALKLVVGAAAARARCFRRCLSNVERRRALDYAKRIGALPDGFDDSSLPWKHDVPRDLVLQSP